MEQTQYESTLKISPNELQLIDMNLVSYIKMLDGTVILISSTPENENLSNSFKNAQFAEIQQNKYSPYQNNQTSSQILRSKPQLRAPQNFKQYIPPQQNYSNSNNNNNILTNPKSKNIRPNFAPPVCYTPQFQQTNQPKTFRSKPPTTAPEIMVTSVPFGVNNFVPKTIKNTKRGKRGKDLASKPKPSVFRARPKMGESDYKQSSSTENVLCPLCGREKLSKSVDHNNYYYENENNYDY